MKFGMFMLNQSPDGRPEATIYKNCVDQARLADGLGFEAVWLAEHHFSSYGYTPNPLMFAVHIASATEHVRIGTAVVVVPLYHPLRLAEDIALADHLTHGRLEVGFGSGYQPSEFARFGINIEAKQEYFDQGLEIITKALAQDEFAYDGTFFKIPDTTMFPKPLQHPHPPFWIAAQRPESIASTVKRGFKCITGGSTAPSGAVLANWEAFKTAIDNSDAGWPQEFAIQSQVYVSSSEEDAREQLANALWHLRVSRGLRMDRLKVVDGSPVEEALDEEPDPEVMYNEWLLFGTPDTVSKKLERLLANTGITYLNGVFATGRLSHEKTCASVELFAREIMPHFRNRVGLQGAGSIE